MDLRERQTKMEGSFADAANNHGLKRSRWRGLKWQRVQDDLIAACQNLRILVSHLNKLKPAGARRELKELRGILGRVARDWAGHISLVNLKAAFGRFGRAGNKILQIQARQT
jgi:hypothetical protein